MAGKSRFLEKKPEARRLYEEGVARREISRRTGVPISTINRWADTFKAEKSDPDQAECPDPDQQKPARPKLIPIEGGRAQVAKYSRVVETALRIMEDSKQPGGVRVMAANTMLKAIALSAELPAHILREEESSSVASALEEVEVMEEQAIAQRYREMLG